MLLHETFIHLPGIGKSKELELKEAGLLNLQQLVSTNSVKAVQNKNVRKEIERSIRALENRDFNYFYEKLPRQDLWRMIPGYEKNIAFLDIETTGLAHPPVGKVTTIAVLMNGKLYQAYSDKQKKQLVEQVQDEAGILVTYFGENFDVPFLRKQYNVPLRKAHLDLCFTLRRLGYTGGLKSAHKWFRNLPPRKSQGIDGFDAVRLWNMYKNGNKKALETLLFYNAEDTILLQPLLERAINLCLKNSHFQVNEFKMHRPIPRIPGKVHTSILKALRDSRSSVILGI